MMNARRVIFCCVLALFLALSGYELTWFKMVLKHKPLHAYHKTTCNRKAFLRGPGQKVVAFSLYLGHNNEKQKLYYDGIEANVQLVAKYYPGWLVRLYTDMGSDPRVISLEKQYANLLDVCIVDSLPGTPMMDATKMFPMIWRFFPTLDPQVDLYLSRDLDSRISEREVAAVNEWLNSDKAMHVMRDHPDHSTSLLGGTWGAKLQTHRKKWKKSWQKILLDSQTWALRDGEKGPDQKILDAHVWNEWASRRNRTLQHDSYKCLKFPGSFGFPTKRSNEKNNFVGCVIAEGNRIWIECPMQCRRVPEWQYC